MWTLRLIIVGLIAIFPVPLCAESPEGDETKLQGEWSITKLEVRGKSAPAEFLETGKYVFKDQTLTIYENDKQVGVSTFSIDSKQTPGTMNLIASEGKDKGRKMLGIYKFDDDKLILCIGGNRPKEFTGAGEAGLLHLIRIEAD